MTQTTVNDIAADLILECGDSLSQREMLAFRLAGIIHALAERVQDEMVGYTNAQLSADQFVRSGMCAADAKLVMDLYEAAEDTVDLGDELALLAPNTELVEFS